MQKSTLDLPSKHKIKKHVISSLDIYLGKINDQAHNLPINEKKIKEVNIPLLLESIQIPKWSKNFCKFEEILVPREACGKTKNWNDVDWWLASFLMLECWHERVYENKFGSINSYSFKLKGWDTRIWEKPWVNHIGIFLMAWCKHLNQSKNCTIYNYENLYQIELTHDVDAIKKTIPIRIKQSIFNIYNCLKFMLNGNLFLCFKKLKNIFIFMFTNDNWNKIEEIIKIASDRNLKATFFFYCGSKSNIKEWFFDPSYNIADSDLLKILRFVRRKKCLIGIHPSFNSVNSIEKLKLEVSKFKLVNKNYPKLCRQHWLRFNWNNTWLNQEINGIEKDYTLMFNDRIGFRSSAALTWSPWNQSKNSKFKLIIKPTLFMDSHFYDYKFMNSDVRKKNMRDWVNKVKYVGGNVAVLWHPHTLSNNYGWQEGYRDLVDLIGKDRND